MERIEGLGTATAYIATTAAAEYLRVHALQANDAELRNALCEQVHKALPMALADAKEAFDCGMPQVAEQTFKLSIAQAGILAAQAVGRSEGR